ncbi:MULTISPECIES: MlaD family protein [Mycobacterium avium complex (MAC)]|uniref:MlaD family protein n=1 Tax=Mycobacterium avium complex (MAC) TaxID=120793 RepID=UPI000566BDCE|nr:MlaD family protein [Mycobacterium intracellulare]MCA2273498.1 MCE family protein [Mycobacterium intracellulare]MCA2326062.1 MCE family protein [Mycobacterium intracellulare]UEB24792.1 MlaD family protein [Mycobacterium intracellulare]
MSVNSLPQPGTSYRGGYDIILEFDNVLSLPDRAKVVEDGTTVGVVTGIAINGQHVDVTSRIDSKVVVPANVRATLQQATVLGDTYVALERPQSDKPALALGPGGRVPLTQTISPPQLEDTIANLANFVGSGSIQRAQNSIIKINHVTPARTGELRELVERVATDLSDLSNNIDVVDKWLDGVAGTANVMHQNIPKYQYFWSKDGMLGWKRSAQVGSYLATVLPSVGSIYSGGYWTVPLLKSLGDAIGAIQQSKWAYEKEAPAWQHLLTDFFLPVDKYPAINITSIKSPDGKEMSDKVQDVLRILGATP